MFDERSSVQAARLGDARAFNRLVEEYQRLAYNVAYRTLGDPDEAADATQDAFLSAYRAMGGFRGESFRAWLLRIVVNACHDRVRRRQRRGTRSLDQLLDDPETSFQPPDPRPGPEQAALTVESAEAIQQALNRLSDEHRTVVILCDVQGMSYEETAETLEVAIGTVRSRLSRARANLRQELTALGELRGGQRRLHLQEGVAAEAGDQGAAQE